MTIFLYVLGFIVVWTVAWLAYGTFMNDPSGDGRLAVLFIAFFWVALPYIYISEFFDRFRKND